ncbi:hypothetical protein FACS1894170_00060 [Planctomycetales bacterium]|nr:hypothetical protein FACS1894170_00060 [Planctomycetales bacterium]
MTPQMNRLIIAFAMLFSFSYCQSEESAVCVDFTRPMYSRLDDAGRTLLTDYAEKYPRVKDFYQNVRFEVNEKVYRYTSDVQLKDLLPSGVAPVLQWETEMEIRHNKSTVGQFSRADRQYIQAESQDGQTSQKNSEQHHVKTISILSPTMAYELSQANEQSQYFALNVKRSFTELLKTRGIPVWQFDTAPFAAGVWLLEDLFFRQPPYVDNNIAYYISVASVNKDGEGLVELKSPVTHSPNDKSIWTVRLFRDTWVVKDVFFQGTRPHAPKFWMRYQCTYKGTKDGIPLLSKYIIDSGRYDANDETSERLVQRKEYDVRVIPGPVPLKEFDVKQFLPPEAGDVDMDIATATLSTRRIACLVIGVVLLITGIGLQIWRARRSRNK